jgi:hypothetical protein
MGGKERSAPLPALSLPRDESYTQAMASPQRKILTPYGQPSRSLQEIRAAVDKVAGQFKPVRPSKKAVKETPGRHAPKMPQGPCSPSKTAN